MSVVIPLTVCLLNASAVHHIEPEILLSIISVEGGRVGAVSVNKNGSEDLGIMQINTHAWLPLVSNTFSLAISRLQTKSLPMMVVLIYMLAHGYFQKRSQRKMEMYGRVGKYHSKTPTYKYKYIEKVKKEYERIKNYR